MFEYPAIDRIGGLTGQFDIEKVLDDPQLNAGNALLDVTLEDGSTTKLPRLPMQVEGDDFGLRMQAPRIGEHTTALLHELGYSDDNITQFEAEAVTAKDG